MDLNARKDHYSQAIVRAVAATAGVASAVPEHDQDSIDMTLAAADTDAGPGPKLDLQLKCSQNIDASGESFSFDLPVKNYDDLRRQVYVPRLLVIVDVPPDPSAWLTSDPEKVTLKRCAYWRSLAGMPDSTNLSTVAVTINTEQVFDVDALLHNLQSPGATL
jgi:hypothetical protein